MGSKRTKQTTIEFGTWGGKRRGAGRKPARARAGVSHGARPELSARHPVLVTLKVARDVRSLRSRRAVQRIVHVLASAACRAEGAMRVVHYSVQHDHAHLVVEADGKAELTRGMRSLTTRLALALKALLGHRGKVFPDRYHQRVLTTPRQVRAALRYVLLNARKHGIAPSDPRWVDPCSSAATFDGWSIAIGPLAALANAPRTWLLRVGWRRGGGPLHPREVPGPLAR